MLQRVARCRQLAYYFRSAITRSLTVCPLESGVAQFPYSKLYLIALARIHNTYIATWKHVATTYAHLYGIRKLLRNAVDGAASVSPRTGP